MNKYQNTENNRRLKTPVAFFIFNRPETTKKVFAAIAKAKPPRLFIVADGPRENYPLDRKKCQEAREIVENINWECEVLKNYSDKNLGLKKRISSGLDWVFSQVERAIILEDDTLPSFSFFFFCEELLDKYKDDERIALISGTNLQIVRKNSPFSYYFSLYPQIWGWATWKRFWKYYDVDIKEWPRLKNTSWLKNVLGSQGEACNYWKRVFDEVYEGRTKTWGYQITFAAWTQNALAIIPKVNLVSNIGAGVGATHMRRKWHKFSNLKRLEIEFPLSHPKKILPDKTIDKFVEKYSLTPFKPLPARIFLYLACQVRRWFVERFYTL